MFTRKGMKKVMVVVCLIVIFSMRPAQAYAWCSARYQYYPPYYKRIVKVPRRHRRIIGGGLPHYYYNRPFRRRVCAKYVTITPVATVVRRLPPTYQTIIIDGKTYHTYGTVYYPQEHAVSTIIQTPLTGTSTVRAITDTYVVNVPNANGSYMPVVIKKVDGAYVGPEGEYYAQPPTVEQLQVMYAK